MEGLACAFDCAIYNLVLIIIFASGFKFAEMEMSKSVLPSLDMRQ